MPECRFTDNRVSLRQEFEQPGVVILANRIHNRGSPGQCFTPCRDFGHAREEFGVDECFDDLKVSKHGCERGIHQ